MWVRSKSEGPRRPRAIDRRALVLAEALEVLGASSTHLGRLCLRRRRISGNEQPWVTELALDHEFLMSSYVTASERTLASHAINLHGGSGLRLLIGGLGLGYTAHEALASSRVAKVEVVELLPPVISWFEEGLMPVAPELACDPRLKLVHGDVFELLAFPAHDRYDAILVDVDLSPDERLGPTSASFYSEAGLRRAREHLTEDGVLAVWSYRPHVPFVEALRAVFGRHVAVHPITVLNELCGEMQTAWLFFARR